MNVRAMTRRAILLACAALLLLAAGAALARAPATVDRYVVGSGGGHAETSPYVLDATVGQAVTGVDGANVYEVCAGFWCRGVQEVYLPVVLRSFP